MALARIKTWIAGEILKAADLNGEFNNILNNPVSLLSPSTGAINFNLQTHTNLLPSAITASSGSPGSVLVASTAATSVGSWSGGASAGGVFTASTASIPTWLTVGTSGQVLTVTSSGTPAWASAPISGFFAAQSTAGGTIAANTYYGLGGVTFQAADSNAGTAPIPAAGRLVRLAFSVTTTATAGNSHTVTVMIGPGVGAVASTMVATMTTDTVGNIASYSGAPVVVTTSQAILLRWVKVGADNVDIGATLTYQENV